MHLYIVVIKINTRFGKYIRTACTAGTSDSYTNTTWLFHSVFCHTLILFAEFKKEMKTK